MTVLLRLTVSCARQIDMNRGAFAKLAPDVEVESTGCLRLPGRPSPAAAIVAAQEFGMDLECHRSNVFTECMVRGADAIFVFEHDQEKDLLAGFLKRQERSTI